MSANKTVPTNMSVTTFINSIQHQQKKQDTLKLIKIIQKITQKKPTMWGSSIIGFGSYHYKYDSGREGDMPMVGFSPRKQSLTLYLMTDFDTHQNLLNKLGKHKTSKACLYINKLEDIDIKVLQKLITQSYQQTMKKYF